MSRQLAVVLFMAVVSPVAAQEQITGWHTDLDAACKVARQSGKPLFVVFRCVR